MTPLALEMPPVPELAPLLKMGAENCCVDVDPMVFVAPVLNRFNPNCVNSVRSTLANLTLRRI